MPVRLDGAATDMSAGRHLVAGRMAERADFLAYLERKRANALTISGNAGVAASTRDRAVAARQMLDVLIGEVTTGLHVGEAEAQDFLREDD